jgi:hypothetical protein
MIHDPLPKLQPYRIHDQCLMSTFLTGQHTNHELRMLLAWPQYFDVIYLSEIVDVAGTHLLKTVWDGCLPQRTTDRASRARPPPQRSLDLALWRRALLPFVTSFRNRQLPNPLGPWLSPPSVS